MNTTDTDPRTTRIAELEAALRDVQRYTKDIHLAGPQEACKVAARVLRKEGA